jgi:hypothetical protein
LHTHRTVRGTVTLSCVSRTPLSQMDRVIEVLRMAID